MLKFSPLSPNRFKPDKRAEEPGDEKNSSLSISNYTARNFGCLATCVNRSIHATQQLNIIKFTSGGECEREWESFEKEGLGWNFTQKAEEHHLTRNAAWKQVIRVS